MLIEEPKKSNLFKNVGRSVVWSATPTPFTESKELDVPSIGRMMDHHAALGVDGVFLAGTCGEGPWMKNAQILDLLKIATAANQGRMKLGVQVTDNSASRTLDRIDAIAEVGCDYAVVAQPFLFMNATPSRVLNYYLEILNHSALPVCFYHRGSRSEFPLEPECFLEILAHPAVEIVKDSSACKQQRAAALKARDHRHDLTLLSGDEFNALTYLRAGYDGMMTGGAVLTGSLLKAMGKAHLEGDSHQAAELDLRAQRILYAAYGGKSLECWLSGLKFCLVRLGIFSTTTSHLEYPLTDECLQEIDSVTKQESSWLLPDLSSSE